MACEFSGVVRRAFRERGHLAYSCDLLPAEDRSPYHFQGDVFDAIKAARHQFEVDLMIAHPPCTYLTSSGARWWPNRKQEQQQALEFVRRLLAAPIRKIALENPPGRIGSQIRKADQYIHPWQFGHMETKTTGLWLKNLPKLVPTNIVRDDMLKLPAHQKYRVHYMSPGINRSKERSRTYEGIARAMAEQWGESE